jgi:protease IV
MTDQDPFRPPISPAGPPVPPPPPAPPAFAPPFGLPPSRRPFASGVGWGAGLALGAGAVLALFSLLAALGLAGLLLAGAAASGDPENVVPTELVTGPEDAEHQLLAVPVNGVILGHASEGSGFLGGSYGYDIARTLDDLDGEDYDGVVLELNTPGGTIYGSRAIAEAVERYRKRTGNEVLAFVQGVSASGGVYAMSGATEIVADYGTLVGSIGVIMGPFERYEGVVAYSGSLFTPGVETTGGITSEYLTAGKGKDLGNPFRDLSQEEREVLTGGLQREYAQFVDWVSSTRGIPARVIRDQLGAYVYDPARAAELGLVDRVGNQATAYARAAELAGIDIEETAVRRQVTDDFLTSLLGVSGQGAGEADSSAAQAPGPASLCSGRRVTLAYHGDLGSLCGR